MQKTIWEKYAEVLVDYSTNVQKGDLVVIRAESQGQNRQNSPAPPTAGRRRSSPYRIV